MFSCHLGHLEAYGKSKDLWGGRLRNRRNGLRRPKLLVFKLGDNNKVRADHAAVQTY